MFVVPLLLIISAGVKQFKSRFLHFLSLHKKWSNQRAILCACVVQQLLSPHSGFGGKSSTICDSRVFADLWSYSFYLIKVFSLQAFSTAFSANNINPPMNVSNESSICVALVQQHSSDECSWLWKRCIQKAFNIKMERHIKNLQHLL